MTATIAMNHAETTLELSAAQRSIVEQILHKTIGNRGGKAPGTMDTFVTGAAGSGKSRVLQGLLVAAETAGINALMITRHGVDAVNGGGSTIQHSCPAVNSCSAGRREGVELLIVDEVSTVGAAMLERRIAPNLRRWSGPCMHDLGDVTVVFFGDLHQLPPPERDYIFESILWRDNVEALWLKENHRHSDAEFIENLAMLRESDARCVPYFDKLVIKPEEEDEWAAAPRIVSRRSRAVAHNEAMASRVVAESGVDVDNLCITRTQRTRAAVVPNSKAVFLGVKDVDHVLPSGVVLLPGVQIMFTKNENCPADQRPRYRCGDLGVIVEVLLPAAAKITVRMVETGETVPVVMDKIEYKVYGDSSQCGAARGWPFGYGWALTMHGSQGLALPRAVVDPRDIFTDGQLYVAVSRVRGPECLRLAAPLDGTAMKPNEKVAQEYIRLASACCRDDAVANLQGIPIVSVATISRKRRHRRGNGAETTSKRRRAM